MDIVLLLFLLPEILLMKIICRVAYLQYLKQLLAQLDALADHQRLAVSVSGLTVMEERMDLVVGNARRRLKEATQQTAILGELVVGAVTYACADARALFSKQIDSVLPQVVAEMNTTNRVR